MKLIFTLISCFFFNILHAQTLEAVKLLPPESKEYSDLTFLKDELKGKLFVMLGEQTHMYTNIFEMKARVVEYLHKELGFTTVALEAPMYDLWKVNQKGFNSKSLNEVIWSFWAFSPEFQRLLNYIEKNNLKVIGFDSQINMSSQFVEDFFDYFHTQNITFKLDEDDMGIIIEEILQNLKFDDEDIEYTAFEKELKRIIDQIEKLETNETNYYWTQFVKSLLASSQDIYFNKVRISTMDFGNKNDNIRDKQMADNLLSYQNRYPDEKIVVWADNVHIINDNSSITNPIAKDFISMGSYIHKELKDKSYSLASIHANDSLFDYGTKKWESTPIKMNSFEDELSNMNRPYLFVTSNQEAMKTTKDTRLLNFLDFTEARLDQLHDGYIFFKNATIPKLDTIKDSISISNKQLDLGKKIAEIKVGKNIVLKGQILDKKTNESIPFTTIILKNEEIYRVADENGFYELSVKGTILDNASVSISSMGYETKTILLKEINDKTYLDPKFEQLDEVVVTGYVSPKTVLKKAIDNKDINYPIDPFNYHQYSKILINKNDVTELDLEYITKEYDGSYLSLYRANGRVEQIKWNKNKNPKRFQTTTQLESFRHNAIRYASILHKRKYKKFKLNFVKSNKPLDEEFYIIAFQTNRNKGNYSGRNYPTVYSGRVYIDKKNFAVVKVIENRETTLKKDEIESFLKESSRTITESTKDIIQQTIKEESICYYSDIMKNGKYYATKYFNRSYNEIIDNQNNKKHEVIEKDFYLFDFKLKNIEEIEYYEYNNKKENSLFRVEYDKEFWDLFYKREIIKTGE